MVWAQAARWQSAASHQSPGGLPLPAVLSARTRGSPASLNSPVTASGFFARYPSIPDSPPPSVCTWRCDTTPSGPFLQTQLSSPRGIIAPFLSASLPRKPHPQSLRSAAPEPSISGHPAPTKPPRKPARHAHPESPQPRPTRPTPDRPSQPCLSSRSLPRSSRSSRPPSPMTRTRRRRRRRPTASPRTPRVVSFPSRDICICLSLERPQRPYKCPPGSKDSVPQPLSHLGCRGRDPGIAAPVLAIVHH
ncbi:hypothetical protein B0T11DRAFT_16023 [Plectosphaerella cucumerina]|uniref:Uncharacterized protein n=1 Tax=Plectosphaerella cucumerina TaxID=40658 RepID=A0A8K0TSY8_9PEZI|nr:hypothetical protein B0T11DRAFT_16023 [Plectosphaerella cucumerina]